MLARAVLRSGLPFGVLDTEHWRAFLAKIRPAYKAPPDLFSMGDKLLEHEYEVVQTAAMDAVSLMPAICLTIDGTTLRTGAPVLNVMACGPAPIFLEHIYMGTNTESAANLLAKLISVKRRIDEYAGARRDASGLDFGGHGFLASAQQKMWSLCTDSPSVMTALRRVACSDGVVSFAFGCSPHALNNLCLDWIKLSQIQTVVGHCVTLVTSLRRVHLLMALFSKLCLQHHGVDLRLVLFTKTRWSTCRFMLERLLKVLLDNSYSLEQCNNYNIRSYDVLITLSGRTIYKYRYPVTWTIHKLIRIGQECSGDDSVLSQPASVSHCAI